MALDDDIRVFTQIPLFRLLEKEAVRLLAFSAETKLLRAGDVLARSPAPLDCGNLLIKGALAIRPNGKPFTETSIGDALATRDLMNSLRETGTMTGGPAPFNKQDRSRFLSAFDTLVNQAKRKKAAGPL